MSFYVDVNLQTNHQQICVLTCAQPTWSLTEVLPYSADHSPTLWRHRWQAVSEFSCTTTPLFGESWAKYRQKTPEMLSPTRYYCRVFKISRLTTPKKKPRSARFFETALRAVFISELMSSLIRINSGPNILRSCFLHWPWIWWHTHTNADLPAEQRIEESTHS